MKVSIITCTYNSEETIRDTILSVRNQTYNNVEHIIIDGASTDNTLSIIKNEGHEGPIISELDKGIYDAMNKGISVASGDIIGILNSDDIYPNSFLLSQVMEQFNLDSALDIVYGDLSYVKKNDTNKVIRKWVSKTYYNRFFENGNVPPHPTLFIKSSVYRRVGLFNLNYKLAADYEWMLKLFKKHHFKSLYLHRLMVKMRLGGATNKNLKNIVAQNKEILEAWKNNELEAPIYLMPFRIIKRLVQFIQ